MKAVKIVTALLAVLFSASALGQQESTSDAASKTELLIQGARKALEEAKLDQALALARQAVAVGQGTVHMLDAYATLGEALMEKGSNEEATTVLRQYYKAGINSRLELNLAMAASKTKRADVAKSALNGYLIVKGPTLLKQLGSTDVLREVADQRGIEVVARLMRSLLGTTSIESALKDIEKVKEQVPQYLYLLSRGTAYEVGKDFKSARAEYEKVSQFSDSKWREFSKTKIANLPREG